MLVPVDNHMTPSLLLALQKGIHYGYWGRGEQSRFSSGGIRKPKLHLATLDFSNSVHRGGPNGIWTHNFQKYPWLTLLLSCCFSKLALWWSRPNKELNCISAKKLSTKYYVYNSTVKLAKLWQSDWYWITNEFCTLLKIWTQDPLTLV